MSFIILVLALVLLVVGTPLLALLYLRKRLISAKRIDLAKCVTATIFLYAGGFLSFIYFGIYPTDSYYKNTFTEITHQKFPASGQIITSSDDMPFDPHGSYVSCFKVELGRSDFQFLLTSIRADSTFSALNSNISQPFVWTSMYDAVAGKISQKNYRVIFSRNNYSGYGYEYIGFLRDGRTLIVYHCGN